MDDDSLIGRSVETPVQNGKLVKGIVISEGYDGRTLVKCCDGEQWTGWNHQVNFINK